jgi:beta-galactosidase
MESAIALGENVKYVQTCLAHYRPFWERGIPVDVIDQTCDFSCYELLIAPMLYMLREGVAERIERFVAAGGTLVLTYWSGIVDEHDLCFLGGFPGGGLRKVLGIWDEELDVLQPFDSNSVVMTPENSLGLTGQYQARELCALIHAEGAKVLARYGEDFAAGRPALTVNTYGEGQAYYVASRNEESFIDAFYTRLIEIAELERVLGSELPRGVTAQLRSDGQRDFVFLMNFSPNSRHVDFGHVTYVDRLNDRTVHGSVKLSGYGCMVLER